MADLQLVSQVTHMLCAGKNVADALLFLQVGRSLVPVLWGRGRGGPARSHLPNCARAYQEVPTVQ